MTDTPITKNVANILALADFLAQGKYRFHMGESTANPECGSAGCIGGHAAVLWSDIRDRHSRTTFSWNEDALCEKLGINYEQENEMCFCSYSLDTELGDVDRRRAVDFLKALAITTKPMLLWDRVK